MPSDRGLADLEERMSHPAPSVPFPPDALRRSPASFGAIGAVDGVGTEEPDYLAIARSREFRELRRELRRFVFPMSALFFAWYLFYVITAAYLPEFMAIRVLGEINIGLVLGIGQFVSTVLITLAYARFTRRRVDPRVAALRTAVREGIPLDTEESGPRAAGERAEGGGPVAATPRGSAG